MSIKTEGVHAGEFLLSEANGTRSREEITLAATAVDLPAGQLLGKLTASGHYAPYDPDADPADGSETVTAILWAPVGASTEAQRSVGIVRDAEVIERLLTGLDTAGEIDLLALGIVVRP
ncbi:head decoration protein [Stutzerimonas nitrititolerans]|uniref:head decoration protein n=1 Tax=Stutzerimonas nitrititolerans TaxID=2482751 RepID=UPI0028AE9C07|nr:head decoration protein [Stutzerimonas nitrititolerans]